MGVGRARRTGPGGGKIFRLVPIIGCALVLCGLCAPAASGEEAAAISTEEWQRLLLEHNGDFASSRLDFRQAGRALSSRDPVRARQLLQRSSEKDRRFDQPHRQLAWLDLRAGRSTVLGELLEGTRDRWSGYRNQVLATANALIGLDLVLAVFLIWCSALLLIRYLPYMHHRLARRVLVENHGNRFARWLWPAVIAPFVIAAGWGLVPWLVLSVVVIWLYADRRPRVLLATVLIIFIAQGIWARPVATILTGTAPSSRAALVDRAAYEPPTTALLHEVDRALADHQDDPDLLSARGLLLARRGDFESSATTLRHALELRPKDPMATSNLAAVHFFRGDMDRAVAGFQRAASLDSTRAVIYYNLSQAYLQKLYLKEGGEALQSALSRDFSLSFASRAPAPRRLSTSCDPGSADSWRIAWASNASLTPFDLLEPWRGWIGVPRPTTSSAGSPPALIISIALAHSVFPRRKLVFECAQAVVP